MACEMAAYRGLWDDCTFQRVERLFQDAIKAAEGTLYERNIAARAEDLSRLKAVDVPEWLRCELDREQPEEG